MKIFVTFIAILCSVVIPASGADFGIVKSYPSDSEKIKTLSGETFYWQFTEPVAKVIFYVHNVTTNKQVTMKMITPSTPTDYMEYYFDPTVGNNDIYALSTEHEFQLHWTAYYRYTSMNNNQKAGEGVINIIGNDPNAPLLSKKAQLINISPSTNDYVFSNSEGSTVDFKLNFTAAVASAEAWVTTNQGVKNMLSCTIEDKTVTAHVPTSYASGGSCSLFVRVRDDEGHIVGDGSKDVDAVNGYLQFSYASEIGLPTPKLIQDGMSYDNIKELTFTYSQGIGLNQDVNARWKDIKIEDIRGNNVITGFAVSQFSSQGDNSIRLSLSKPITTDGLYVVTLPYASFVLGEEIRAMLNSSSTYTVMVENTTAITSTPTAETHHKPFTINGTPATSASKGVVIVDGKKKIVTR